MNTRGGAERGRGEGVKSEPSQALEASLCTSPLTTNRKSKIGPNKGSLGICHRAGSIPKGLKR